MGTIFIAGVYGVGKSTLVQKLASRINTPCFSSSTIISAVNGEQYGRNKAVKDKYKNQEILVARVSELLKELEQIYGEHPFLRQNVKYSSVPKEFGSGTRDA